MSRANGTMNGSFLTVDDIGQICTWTEINEIHKARHGIYQRNGRLISLLTDFGKINPCYPDFHGESTQIIHYTGSGRRGDQKLDARNQALCDAIQSGIAVPLFNKLGVNRWEYIGEWRVTDAVYVFEQIGGRMVWKFTLQQDLSGEFI